MARTTKAPHNDRRAVPGQCLRCGLDTIRGIDQFGRVVEADRAELDAAHELDAHLYGRETYCLMWRGHLELDGRTPNDTITAPAGYRRDARILREHRCPMERDL